MVWQANHIQSTSTPSVTIDPTTAANLNPVKITGRFESTYPVEIVLSPGNVLANLDRNNRTYQAEVTLQPGENLVRATVVYPLGASSVERTVLFEPDFEWISAAVFPNPARLTDELTQLRGEGNLPMEALNFFIYASDGSLVKQKTGVPDGSDPRIWRAWWNHQNASAAGGRYRHIRRVNLRRQLKVRCIRESKSWQLFGKRTED